MFSASTCLDNVRCYLNEAQVADQTCGLTSSQYIGTQAVLVLTTRRQMPGKVVTRLLICKSLGFVHCVSSSRGGRLTSWPLRWSLINKKRRGYHSFFRGPLFFVYVSIFIFLLKCVYMQRQTDRKTDTQRQTDRERQGDKKRQIYLCPSLPVEHRPSTTPRHRTLFWAALVIPDQLVPCYFSSASVSCLQLLRGRPLFLFPCGFQVRAWHAVLDAGFLRVCPIQPHFFRSICLATGSCPARSHRSSFRIFSCHWIL